MAGSPRHVSGLAKLFPCQQLRQGRPVSITSVWRRVGLLEAPITSIFPPASHYSDPTSSSSAACAASSVTRTRISIDRLVPVVESDFFVPGAGPQVLPDGLGLEICLDMDSPDMIRRDEVTTRPELLAVPASEIGTHGDWSNLGPAADDWFHARDAILRSVENGVPMARSAGRGLLALSDRYGRIIAQAPSRAGFTTLVAELPLSRPGGATLYDRIGDAFGWFCLVLGIGMVGTSWLGRLSAGQVWESRRRYG